MAAVHFKENVLVCPLACSQVQGSDKGELRASGGRGLERVCQGEAVMQRELDCGNFFIMTLAGDPSFKLSL